MGRRDHAAWVAPLVFCVAGLGIPVFVEYRWTNIVNLIQQMMACPLNSEKRIPITSEARNEK